MVWIVVILLIVGLVVWGIGKSGREDQVSKSTAAEPDDFAYGMAWPKPDSNNLWDTLDFFVRLAEVHSERASDPTTVSLTLQPENFGNARLGDFEVRYFDGESARRRFARVYLKTKKAEDNCHESPKMIG